jgi:UDP-GlcNAc3NAcA epimerase
MHVKIMTIVGARPQFIKAAAFARALKKHTSPPVQHTLVHTGQHYDEMMSDVFFRELEIGEPEYNLAVAGGTHGAMTGRMIERIEALLIELKPDWILLYGDTNSTIAGALAAAKLHIRIAHVEAGLRSFNMRMPEEINRVVTDRLSTLLFCPTQAAVDNLRREGLIQKVSLVGDVMYDVALQFAEMAENRSRAITRLELRDQPFVLATCHRAENTDNPERLAGILRALNAIAQERTVVLPIHPRTRKTIDQLGLNTLLARSVVIDPLSYLDMVMLEKNATAIITDSGGVQKEAFFYKVPCITTRDETEWLETIEAGWNVLTGADEQSIVDAFRRIELRNPKECQPYGDGHAAEYILTQILSQVD